MQLAIGIIGIIAFVFAILHLFFFNFLSILNSLGREIILDLSVLLERHRIAVGIFYLFASVFLVYIGFFYK